MMWLRLQLPFALDHINLWLLTDAAGDLSLIDTGFRDAPTIAAWQSLQSQGRLSGLRDIFITHFHPDHIGMCGWLAHETGARLTSTVLEWQVAALLFDRERIESMSGQWQTYYVRAGLDENTINALMSRRFNFSKGVSSLPATVKFVQDGDDINLGSTTWRIITGGGHSPEHACLYDPIGKVLISGDIVLPQISPNIGLYPASGADENPVADYFDVLARLEKAVPDDVLVLPSHGTPFYGLHSRIHELRGHHEKRLKKMRDILSAHESMTAIEVMHALFAHRKLGEGEIPFALGETLAHLLYDVKAGMIDVDTSNPTINYTMKALNV